MDPEGSYRTKIYSLVNQMHGIVTTSMADAIGVPAVELRKLYSRGAIERLGRGVYRIPFAALSSYSDAAEAVELVGPDSFLSGESVLSMLGLGVFNPRKFEVSTKRRVRRNLPGFIRIRQIEPNEKVVVERYHGVRSQSVAQVIRSLLGRVESHRLDSALNEAKGAGLITEDEFRSLALEISSVESRQVA